ncbi:1872_t:CDS:1 [Rhizophagus irregularis]|nr:1872_t:CDS:1 [Rhizophagus irregularis]
MAETCNESCDSNGEVLRQDPQVNPTGCFIYNTSSIADSFNGLATLNSPNRPSLNFPDPYTNHNLMNVGHCIKHCIDYLFTYAALENGINCRCGYADALQTYIEADNKLCNKLCTTATYKGNVTYPCGGLGAYTVYKAEIQYFTPPIGITVEEKLNIMNNIDKDKFKYPNYRGCIEDNRYCGQRVLGNKCTNTETMTVEECINYCREGNYRYAGLEARVQCFCGNTYNPLGRLLGSEYCSNSCPGNNYQLCGGSFALSIYEVPPLSNLNNSNNLPLIIGLSVGLPLLIICVIGFLVYTKKIKICSQSSDDPDDPNNPNNRHF